MLNIPSECQVIISDSSIVLEDRDGGRSKMTFTNHDRNPVKKITIDGCAAPVQRIKCDYLVLDCNQTEHFVELKGRDVKKATEQLEASIKDFSVKRCGYCFIVPTRVPRPRTPSTSVANIKLKFKKDCFILTVKENCTHVLPSKILD